MSFQINPGTTDVSVELQILDSGTWLPRTDFVFNSAGIDLNYRRDGAAVSSITEADLASLTTAHTDGGFLHVANGRYRVDLPDAACATGVPQVTVGGTVTGGVIVPRSIQLISTAPTATGIFNTQMTESYAADGVAPTLAQSLFLIQQSLGDFTIASGVLTVHELDGTTTAASFNLSPTGNPTATTRAS